MPLSAVETVYVNTSVKGHLSGSHCLCIHWVTRFNPIALRKAKIVYNFGLSECNRVKGIYTHLPEKANFNMKYFRSSKVLHCIGWYK